jgi:predicted esterase/catechol 2,3-dioxygenase-like lactoylglutathione lyase family enzyme
MHPILGIHHVTAIAGDPQRNLDFYAGMLGLRLVKRTVNFDDPQSYHLYYGDAAGSPGTLLTFFPWPGARRGRPGVGQVAGVALSVLPRSIAFWEERLLRHGVRFDGPSTRGDGADREHVLALHDADGLAVEIVGHEAALTRGPWGDAAGVPAEHAMRGIHGVTLWVADAGPTERVLVDTLGFRAVHERGGTRRYAVGDGAPGRLVDVRAVGRGTRGAGGAGTVHHVAFAVANDQSELTVREHVRQAGLQPTPVIDRTYFHSVYFREPGGVLFEVATDPPGFTVDEPADRLGEQLMLPPQYERRRAEIEAVLPPLRLPGHPGAVAPAAAGAPGNERGEALGFVHRYLPPASDAEATGGVTLLLLHGTGGDENDLLPLGRALLPGAGMLSPRGQVLERGASRFFRRLAEGVFDQEDLARRTDDLARFVKAAAQYYRLAASAVVGVGFSNGANIAASLLFRHPGMLRTAILLSPMVPFVPDVLPDLAGTAVFIGTGRHDPIATPTQAEHLAELLRRAGADVTVHWTDDGHTITAGAVDAAGTWLARRLETGATPVERSRLYGLGAA